MRVDLWAIALILMLFGVAIAAQRPPQSEPGEEIRMIECADEANVKRAREIMVHGLDLALQDRTMTLFELWMKDTTEQPDRARRGVEQGVDAYLHGREQLLKWDLPPCKK